MDKRIQRRAKTKITLRGTSDRPRLVVFRSNRYIYGQLIDDAKGVTLLSVNKETDPMVAGKKLAEIALKKKIESIVFDRAGYRYHGRVKAFAESARESGLKF
jgi:large subunit ribosomal protein L18